MAKIKIDRSHQLILGVSAGLARAYKIKKRYVRSLFILTTVFGGGMGVLFYIILWISLFSIDTDAPKIFGVCHYLSQKTRLDISYFRILFVFLTLISGIIPLSLFYLIFAIFLDWKK